MMNKALLEKPYKNIFNTRKNYIQTGYSEIDSLLSAYKKGSSITIGGRPLTGKTAFTMNLATTENLERWRIR